MIEKEELLKTTNEEEFNSFLLKYHPDYDILPMNEWKKEIYNHYVENILGMTVETVKKMEDEIVEYEE